MGVSKMILPEYIVTHFVPANACRRCGRSDLNFKLLFPQLKWGKTDIELIYPLRCPCGGSGCVPIKLPKLLFGYILVNVALVDAAHRRRSKVTMTVLPHHRDDMLARMFLDFDRLMEADATTMLRSPSSDRSSIDDRSADDVERIKFGFDKNEWKDFLRRLGLDGPGTENSES